MGNVLDEFGCPGWTGEYVFLVLKVIERVQGVPYIKTNNSGWIYHAASLCNFLKLAYCSTL